MVSASKTGIGPVIPWVPAPAGLCKLVLVRADGPEPTALPAAAAAPAKASPAAVAINQFVLIFIKVKLTKWCNICTFRIMTDNLYLIFGLSLALGMLVGIQREHVNSQVAGMRTYPLITLLGSLTALLSEKLDRKSVV